MPLPKPPAKRADVLSIADAVPAAPRAAAPSARRTTARATAALETAPAVVAAPAPATASPPAASPEPRADARKRPALELLTPAAGTPRAAARPAGASAKARRRAPGAPPTLFVLDTNVLMHDPTALYRFDEHDIYLPMVTLEELDAHKRGLTEVARNARQVSRELDALASDAPRHAAPAGTAGASAGVERPDGIPLERTGHREATGRLFFQTDLIDIRLPAGLPQGKADNTILGVVQALVERHKDRPVVLVSKDINMRVKARALGLPAEDYWNDKTLDDGDLLHTGLLALPADFWDGVGKNVESWQQAGVTSWRIAGPESVLPQLLVNQFVFLEAPGVPSLQARVVELTGRTAVLKTVKDYGHQKNAVWGVTARNRDQNFAINLLMDPEIDFVTLAGTAGSGKTLMSLACGLSQVLDERRYAEIIVTRVTVPVGEDIGFLPGTEEEKMGPWMGALDDNLEVLARTDTSAGEWGRAATQDLVRSKIRIKSLNFMRGRTFLNKFVIIDEAQNLTPKQMKTLITRAGPGTKIVCLGNLAQIDTPYLTEGSSGLTYAVDRFKGWAHSGHVTLARGERSRLADFASEVL